jgi:hypothetical protein
VKVWVGILLPLGRRWHNFSVMGEISQRLQLQGGPTPLLKRPRMRMKKEKSKS